MPLNRPKSTPCTLIIGNSGSGKSTLAALVAERAGCTATSLDDIYWIDQLALQKRGAVAAKQLITERAAGETWVIEGVYGWLIEAAAQRATQLIWLDLPWPDCRANLLARGPDGKSDAEFAGLLAWAQGYWTRQTSSSHAGHAAIFAAFPGHKTALTACAPAK